MLLFFTIDETSIGAIGYYVMPLKASYIAMRMPGVCYRHGSDATRRIPANSREP